MVIFKKKTKYNTIKVVRNDDMITLLSGSDIKQTAINLNNPLLPCLEYARSTILCTAFHSNPKSILMLGMGGGSIATMLYHVYKNASIDVVEIDEEIPEIAQQYFHFFTDSRMKVIIEDALNYVQITKKMYDIIILDTYIGDEQPHPLTTSDFYQKINDMISPEGIFVANLTTGNSSYFENKVKRISKLYQCVWLLPAERKNNMLIFAANKQISKFEIQRNAAVWQTELPSDFPVTKSAHRVIPFEKK